MKALVATAYGQPHQLAIADVPIPSPGPGQILLRITAATINPTDIRAVAGDFGELVQLQFPYVLGNDFAGTITEVGSGVAEYRVGDEVFGQAMPRQLSFVAAPSRPSLSTGALAEFAVFEADTPLLAHRPPEVSAEQAAALAIVGVAARADRRVRRERVSRGRRRRSQPGAAQRPPPSSRCAPAARRTTGDDHIPAANC